MKTWNELPKEIQEKMIEICYEYGSGDVSRMKENLMGGFVWAETPEGHDFWERILVGEDIDHFYYRYPHHLSVYGRLEMLEADIKELRNERDAVSCGCKGVDVKIPEKKENIVTHFPERLQNQIKINYKWAGNLYFNEEQGKDYDGCAVSGHKASLYLNDINGQWYDECGNKVTGYFYYKPKDEG